MDYSKDEYTTKEAASLLGMSEFTLRRKIRNKEIDVIGKEGKSYIISKEEIERYIKEKRGNVLVPTIAGPIIAKAAMSMIKGVSPAVAPILYGKTFIQNLVDLFDNKDDNDDKNIGFYKNYYKSRQKDLNISKLELERLMLDKDDTIEYKKKELDLRIQIESIEKDLQIIKMKIDSMDKWYNLLWGKVSFVYKK